MRSENVASSSLVNHVHPADRSPHPLGVIVERGSEQVPDSCWNFFKQQGILPEILLHPSASTPSQSFDFSHFESELKVYSEHGLSVAVSITPHIRTTPWKPQVDEYGKEYTDRQNPFDPDFLAEWHRLHEEFCRQYGGDKRIARVYIAPPSFFGEIEYYNGGDWSHLKFLCYGPLARQRFIEWLENRYGSPQEVAKAWGKEFDSWASLTLPRPRRESSDQHVDKDWLDLMQWRSEYLAKIVSDELNHLGTHFHVSLKFSRCDYTAMHGANAALIVSMCADLPNLILNHTNSHCLSDMKYMANIARHYNLSRWTVENDGNRYTRTELAKSALNVLMAGASEFNFASFRNLTGLVPFERTEAAYALRDVGEILRQFNSCPERKEIAFLHSNTTCYVRAPDYLNNDVAHVYDAPLTNAGSANVPAYSWARFLDQPDVIGEQLIMDGDLSGRRMVIIPNSSLTVLPEQVINKLCEWIQAGGTLVVFGNRGLPLGLVQSETADDKGDSQRMPLPQIMNSKDEVQATSGFKSAFANSEEPLQVQFRKPYPVWTESPDPEWQSLVEDTLGRIALAQLMLGKGRIIVFPAPVPGSSNQTAGFYSSSVPILLRGIAEALGCKFAFWLDPNDSAPLSLAYVGKDVKSGKHLFVGGAYDDTSARLRLIPNAGMKGSAEIILIDMQGVRARSEQNKDIAVTCTRPYQSLLYQNPTVEEFHKPRSLVFYSSIRFPLPEHIEIALRPDFPD